MNRRFFATYADIGKAIEQARKELGESQMEIAKKTGVELEFIIDLEAGQPKADLAKILDVLHSLDIHAVALPTPPVDDSLVNLAEVVAQFA